MSFFFRRFALRASGNTLGALREYSRWIVASESAVVAISRASSSDSSCKGVGLGFPALLLLCRPANWVVSYSCVSACCPVAVAITIRKLLSCMRREDEAAEPEPAPGVEASHLWPSVVVATLSLVPSCCAATTPGAL